MEEIGAQITKILPTIFSMKTAIAQDKAYGIYNILQRFGITMADPDYSKSVEKIFEELAFALLRDTRSLQAPTAGKQVYLPGYLIGKEIIP